MCMFLRVCCVYHRFLELAVFCRLMVLLNLVFPGRMFGEFCCAPVSWGQALFTRMLGPLQHSRGCWHGQVPSVPPTTGLCSSDSLLSHPSKNFSTKAACFASGVWEAAVKWETVKCSSWQGWSTGGFGVRAWKMQPHTHSGCSTDTQGMLNADLNRTRQGS